MQAARVAAPVTLDTLLAGIANAPAVAVSAVALDSRLVTPGSVFLACQGATVHGLHHLPQALRLGACAVVWETAPGVTLPPLPAGVAAVEVAGLHEWVGVIAARFYAEPSRQLRVVGVTGTNGKTSCSQLLAQALSHNGQACGVLGTLGYGLYGQLTAGTHTTPDAVQLQARLAAFKAQGARYVSMEVSSHALDQNRVAGLQFTGALFTNLTRDHLDYHGDLDRYAAAKAKLFAMPDLQWAVINHDDAAGRDLLARLPAAVRGIAYSLTPLAIAQETLYAEALDLHANGLRLQLGGSFGVGVLEARLLGRFNAQNLLAVLGALLALDISLDKALALLRAARTVPGRMECFGGGQQPLVVVDYAHTPDALAQALTAARAHCQGKLICVFGCGGDRDRGKRPEMGALAERLADQVIVTDDNPRTENPATIVQNILAGMQQPGQAQVEHARSAAIAAAIAAAQAGDIILVAGKGHEDYQIYGSETRPYSDRVTVAELLGEVLP